VALVHLYRPVAAHLHAVHEARKHPDVIDRDMYHAAVVQTRRAGFPAEAQVNSGRVACCQRNSSSGRSPRSSSQNGGVKRGRIENRLAPASLIKPCMQFSRTRLSDALHTEACAERQPLLLELYSHSARRVSHSETAFADSSVLHFMTLHHVRAHALFRMDFDLFHNLV